ncbi:3-deoxy-D-manno-octulosonic acid transferase, partial [Francisella tularensis subsp. holarctica]|nr:3-deoxy-D-manno-octulosonic acid transferase [Francisella tularensis subsp. holarctica]
LFNFSQISKELIRNKALIGIRNQQEIANNIFNILEDKQLLQQMSSGALKTFKRHSDVLEKQYKNIVKFL